MNQMMFAAEPKKKFNDRPACVNQKKLKDFANGLGSD